MAIFALNQELNFPPPDLAEPDGLLAIGGDLSIQRLLLAYRNGIFPWYEGENILWWSPDPRFVLFPEELKISHSMKQILRKETFRFTMNKAFREVILQCKMIARRGQESTWITEEVRNAYIRLHELGFAYSAEAWHGDQLAGGLYGIRLGNVFFGESMFSRLDNASKFAFIHVVRFLQDKGLKLIDCQVYTAHLESLGARMISRKQFLELVGTLVDETNEQSNASM
jgi:leucyl/phenylalanyl-tRNA--protein transferase